MTDATPLADEWPAELQSVSLDVHFTTAELDFDKLAEALKPFKSFSVKKDRIRATIDPSPSEGEIHGHFWAEVDEDRKGISVNLQVVPGGVFQRHPEAPDLFGLTGFLLRFASVEAQPIKGVLVARFRYSTATHRLAIVLPIALPGVQKQWGAQAEISGLELSFADTTQPLRRAYLETHPDGRIRVVLTTSFSIGDPTQVPRELCSAALGHVISFARPVDSPTPGPS